MKYIVLRNCPTLLADREGRWYSFSRMPEAFHIPTISTNLASYCVSFYPSGHFETREDGARAEIYTPVPTTEIERWVAAVEAFKQAVIESMEGLAKAIKEQWPFSDSDDSRCLR